MTTCKVCGLGRDDKVLVAPDGYCRGCRPAEVVAALAAQADAEHRQAQVRSAEAAAKQTAAEEAFAAEHYAVLSGDRLTVFYRNPQLGHIRVGGWKLGGIGGYARGAPDVYGDENRESLTAYWHPVMPIPCSLEVALKLAKR